MEASHSGNNHAVYIEMARNPLETVQAGYTWLLIIFQWLCQCRSSVTWDLEIFLFFPPLSSDLYSMEENSQFSDWKLNIICESSKNPDIVPYLLLLYDHVELYIFYVKWGMIQEKFVMIKVIVFNPKGSHCHQLVVSLEQSQALPVSVYQLSPCR